MKNILLLITILVFNLNIYAQLSPKSIEHFNNLSTSITESDINKSIEITKELYKSDLNSFIYFFHLGHTEYYLITQQENVVKFFDELYKTDNTEIKEILKPLYLFKKSVFATNNEEAKSITNEFVELLKTKSDFNNKADYYCLATLNQLQKNSLVSGDVFELVLNLIINSISKYENLSKGIYSKEIARERTYFRYVLASANYYLANLYLTPENKIKYLKLAYKYSPDMNDASLYYVYLPMSSFLFGQNQQFKFYNDYYDILTKENNKLKALEVITNLSIVNPIDENINKLKSLHKELNIEKPYNEFWLEELNKQLVEFPSFEVTTINGEHLNMDAFKNKWLFIDVWGTWCQPCLKDMPKIQNLSEKVEKYDNDIMLITLSYSSNNLNNFMKDNNYTFPVAEIDDRIVRLLTVESYPTKILKTPQGKYLKIPFDTDFIKFVSNYTNIELN